MKPGYSAAKIIRHLLKEDTTDALLRHFELYPCYQFVNRGSIRDFDCTDDYTIICADKRQADYIAEVMDTSPPQPIRTDILKDLDFEPLKGGRPKLGLSADEMAERQKEQARDRARRAYDKTKRNTAAVQR
jgi:hypothetical protein